MKANEIFEIAGKLANFQEDLNKVGIDTKPFIELIEDVVAKALQEVRKISITIPIDGISNFTEEDKRRWQKMAGISPLSAEEKFFNRRADLEKSGGFDYEEDGNFIGMSGVQISTKPLSYDDHIAKMSEGLSKAKTTYFTDFGNDEFDKGKMDEFLESWKEKVGGLND